MIKRYRHWWSGGGMIETFDGEYVLYEDHFAAIEEKDKEIERLQTNIDVMKRALRWSEWEEDGDG